ncbi:hypothetical protein KSP40_PGU021960 [Platanthera guangdongensis]|uniref:LAGLIDADG homing endonuclease n=1 Tax=Platanthera guangdongensis TaxID=2320717 RepID=A0ABR2MIN7_9ASPA
MNSKKVPKRKWSIESLESPQPEHYPHGKGTGIIECEREDVAGCRAGEGGVTNGSDEGRKEFMLWVLHNGIGDTPAYEALGNFDFQQEIRSRMSSSPFCSRLKIVHITLSSLE